MLNNPAEEARIGHESIAEITFALIVGRKGRASDQKAAMSLFSTQYGRPPVTNNSLCPENGM
ncbi:MAG: hypothetical protein RID11_13810 [Roseovarius sp.]|jgi:hypothetical protein|uniref:hypothetical protein n=1 Tax=Roseovarius sp. TaxID=1486281 RepID=UPI0032F09B50